MRTATLQKFSTQMVVVVKVSEETGVAETEIEEHLSSGWRIVIAERYDFSGRFLFVLEKEFEAEVPDDDEPPFD